MMVSITLVDVSQYVNLTALSGITGSLLITNTSLQRCSCNLLLRNQKRTTGWTISCGTLRDTISVVTASATAQQSTVGGSGFGERGVAANTTWYYKFTNFGTGTATGVFHIAWEERP